MAGLGHSDGNTISIRITLAICFVLVAVWAVTSLEFGHAFAGPDSQPEQASTDTLDILIKGGRVVDGSGADAVLADIGIRGDRIVLVGNAGSRSASRTI